MKKINKIMVVIGILFTCLLSINKNVSAGRVFNRDSFDPAEFDSIIKLDKLSPYKKQLCCFRKLCFSFLDYDMAKEFKVKLDKSIGAETKLYNSEYSVLTVNPEKYRDTLINGIEILQRDYKDRLEGCCWFNGSDKDKSLSEFFDYQTHFDSAVKLENLKLRLKSKGLTEQSCFLFATYKAEDAEQSKVLEELFGPCVNVDDFAGKLSKAIDSSAHTDWCIWCRSVNVPAEKYKKALIEGFRILNIDYADRLKGCYWVDGNNMKRNINELYDYPETGEFLSNKGSR